jgi:hypothetical protein
MQGQALAVCQTLQPVSSPPPSIVSGQEKNFCRRVLTFPKPLCMLPLEQVNRPRRAVHPATPTRPQRHAADGSSCRSGPCRNESHLHTSPFQTCKREEPGPASQAGLQGMPNVHGHLRRPCPSDGSVHPHGQMAGMPCRGWPRGYRQIDASAGDLASVPLDAPARRSRDGMRHRRCLCRLAKPSDAAKASVQDVMKASVTRRADADPEETEGRPRKDALRKRSGGNKRSTTLASFGLVKSLAE